MKKVGLFNKISKTLQAMVKNFIEQPGIDELLNQNNFTELYRKFKIFLDGEEIPKPEYSIYALTALLLDAGIEIFGENNNKIYCSAFNYLPIIEYRIPEGVTRIGDEAFAYCIFLEKIYIPSTVKNIKEDVFLGCCNLEIIYYDGTYENLKNIAHNNRLFPTRTMVKHQLFICADGTWNSKGEKIV